MSQPTPWSVERSTTGSGTIIRVTDAAGRDVRTSCMGCTTATEANDTTDLIVRAVNAHDDLLAALKLLVADCAGYEAFARPCHALDVAEAAIAKAEAR